MHVVVLLMFSLTGMNVLAALSAALYAALPRHFLECAELHGRFRGLSQEETIPDGTPTGALPDGDALSGQFAFNR